MSISPKAARVIVSKFKQIMSLPWKKKKKKSLSGFLSQLRLELRLLTTRLYVMCSVPISLIFILDQVLLNLSVISTPVTVPPSMLQTNQLPSPSWDRLGGGGHLHFLFLVAAIISPPWYLPGSPGSLFILWPLGKKKTKQKNQKCFLFLC